MSTWDDVVFIPPGFDVSTDPTQQQQAAARVGDDIFGQINSLCLHPVFIDVLG